MKSGKVYLIGAGPGDVELLTLKAVRALAACDVVLLDDLVSREVLQFTRKSARVIEVGKRGGCRSTPQEFIQRLMVRLARTGKTVARVKGGDPFVFGRGGEEVEALRSAGIEAEVINGITSGLAAPAVLGIPVTHRDYCHGVALVTGHTRSHGQLNWKALAQSGMTLVIYMGMVNLEPIAAELMAAGMPEETPAAAIASGTLPQQRQVISNLVNLAAEVKASGLRSPAVIVVGEVVNFAQVAKQAGKLHRVA